jgi:hypothetical protein
LPELASPEPARVTLPETEYAEPLVPPFVSLLAEEFPELPPVAEVSGFDVASPLSPETALAVPLAEPPKDGSTDGSEEGSTDGSRDSLMLCGLAVAAPDPPDMFEDLLEAEDVPVDPVFPEMVWDEVLALPLVALDVEVELVFTEPVVPPLPEEPEVALGSEVAEPLEVDPVDPVSPVVATMVTEQPPE